MHRLLCRRICSGTAAQRQRLGTLSAARAGQGNSCEQRRCFTALPVIDVGPLVDPSQGSAAAKARCARELHLACRDVGFFVVENHGVPAADCARLLREARRWFELPDAAKRSILLRGAATAYRGYQPLGANVTRLPGGGFVRDWHEAIDLFKEEDPAAVQARGDPSSPLHGSNLWPSQLPAFKSALRAHVDACLGLGASILRGIALGLGLREDAFQGLAPKERSYWIARVIHYPPLVCADGGGAAGGAVACGSAGLPGGAAAAAAAGGGVGREVQLSCGEHTDYGLLTLVLQEAGVTALQVQNKQGQWVDAPPMDSTFVCNIGDMFATLTGGLYAATPHRVVNADPSRSRVSVPFFFEPAFEALVAPLPGLSTPAAMGAAPTGRSPPAAAPVRYGAHLESKVLSNFEL